MHFDELQRKVGIWATENFGDQPPSYPLVGASEELGELAEAYSRLYQTSPNSPGIQDRIFLALELQAAVGRLNHSILKQAQGIREDEQGVGVEAERVAMKQIQQCIEELKQLPPEEGREIKLDAVPKPDAELIDAVADTHIYLADFSHRAGLDLDQAVETTWNDIVSERDWDSDLGDHDG